MFKDALAMAHILLKGDVITQKDINIAADKIISILTHLKDYKKELVNEMTYSFNITSEEAKILINQESNKPWLREEKSNIKWNFWERYRIWMLTQGKLSSSAIDTNDTLTDDILDLLFNPNIDGSADKKGLVVGSVQSGKTANYTGLINKAIDAGFKIIIILAGIHNNLRSQTQVRIDEGVLGFDTQSLTSVNKQEIYIGVASKQNKQIKQSCVAHSLTSSSNNGDFKTSNLSAWGINVQTQEPVVAIIKKNVNPLKNIFNWLRSMGTDIDGQKLIVDKSLLLIDDEADHASINTSADPEKATAINNHIRRILSLFAKKAYVGYTATPFANIFIPLDDNNLFPKDFIINLPTPSSYIGPNKIFDFVPDDNNETDVSLPLVSLIDDYHQQFPNGHKKDDGLPRELPDSLKYAIKCFFFNCAIRAIRNQTKEHNTMLVHVSRYIRWQKEIACLVEQETRYIQNGIRYNDPEVWEELEIAYKIGYNDLVGYEEISEIIAKGGIIDDPAVKSHSWTQLKRALPKVSEKITVKELNGNSKDTLDYKEQPNGLSSIVVGADKLSRGMTLEGLSVSYFLRSSKMYDTLMQMGRWFGYRKGYADICRLFISEELYRWFSFINIATNELRNEFDIMTNDLKAKPKDYALMVRSHPGVLQISAANKIRSAILIEVTHAGRLAESSVLSIAHQDMSMNYNAFLDLFNALKTHDYADKKRGYVWYDVQVNHILSFFQAYQSPDEMRAYSPYAINRFITEQIKHNRLLKWRVALMSKSTADKVSSIDMFDGKRKIGWINRSNASPGEDKFTLKKAHIIDPRDEFIDLSEDEINIAMQLTYNNAKSLNREYKQPYPNGGLVRKHIRNENSPLLLLYLVNPPENLKLKDKPDKPFIGYAISFPDDNNYLPVSYKMNEQLLPNLNYDNDFEFDNYDD